MKSFAARRAASSAKTFVVVALGAALGVAHAQNAPDAGQNPGAPTVGQQNGGQQNGGPQNGGPQDGGPQDGEQQNGGRQDDEKGRRGGVYGEKRGGKPGRNRGRDGGMRDLLSRNGLTAPAVQDAILAFLRDDEERRRTVAEARRLLWNGVQRDVPAERLHALLSDYQKALQFAREERGRAQTALDARVGYSLDARLESLLWLLGVLGDGQNVLQWPPPSKGPRGGGNGGPAFGRPPFGGESPFGGGGGPSFNRPDSAVGRQIEGVVSAKNVVGQMWLEIRDDTGRKWRVAPSEEPGARLILNHQIESLAAGQHIVVRVAAFDGSALPNAPLVLLAIVPVPNQEPENERDDNNNPGGAKTPPDGH